MKKKTKIISRETFAPYLVMKEVDERGEYEWAGFLSTNIRWMKYYQKRKELVVSFVGGSKYLYTRVAYQKWEELKKSGAQGNGTIESGMPPSGPASVGVRFWDLIRDPWRVPPGARKARGLKPLVGPYKHPRQILPYVKLK